VRGGASFGASLWPREMRGLSEAPRGASSSLAPALPICYDGVQVDLSKTGRVGTQVSSEPDNAVL